MRYINPGFAEFLDVEDGTTVEGTKFNPDNGVALYQPKDNEGIDITLETAPTHFYAKFDVYIPPWSEMSDGVMAEVGFYSKHSGYTGFYGWQLRKYSSDLDPQVIIGNSSSYDKYVEYKVGGALKFDSVNSFWMHFKARSASVADGEYQVYMNGEKIMENTQKYIYMDAISKLVIYATQNYGKCYLSNIIMSFDEEISLKEKIQAVPLGDVVTDMTAQENGTYLADTAGQQILQTVNVNSLISQYGGISKVTGIAIGGRPAYRTGEDLTRLTGISKAGDEQIEHGTKKLLTNTDMGTVDCYSVNANIADLAGMQLGWKAEV
ncbi:hypothetical protein [Selenomonas ruminantium]|uniref:hypothetical protein n=1 Tax=Selenomonas ruminantium TaxID=971 RepID=UPI00047C195E|nr:hypothetical protein [Selenomonas ruminantium]